MHPTGISVKQDQNLVPEVGAGFSKLQSAYAPMKFMLFTESHQFQGKKSTYFDPDFRFNVHALVPHLFTYEIQLIIKQCS